MQLSPSSKNRINHGFQCFVTWRSHQFHAVDQKRRGAWECVFALPLVQTLLHLRAVLFAIQTLIELLRIQPNLSGVFFQITHTERGGVIEQYMVIIPKLSLIERALTRFRRLR